jgi:hypothetical protein
MQVSKIYTLESGGKIRSCFPDISPARFRWIAILDWGEQGQGVKVWRQKRQRPCFSLSKLERSKSMARKKIETLFQPIKIEKE